MKYAQRRRADSRSYGKVPLGEASPTLFKQKVKQPSLNLERGVGHDSVYFQDRGFDVIATDISPKMVDACKYKTLTPGF